MAVSPAEDEHSCCVSCSLPITDKVIHRDRGAFHQQCIANEEQKKTKPVLARDTCTACQRPIDVHTTSASAIKTEEGMYHLKCFSCILCREPIGDHDSIQYIKTKKGLYCMACSRTEKMQQKELRRKELPGLPKQQYPKDTISTPINLDARRLTDKTKPTPRVRAMSLISAMNMSKRPPTPPPSTRLHNGERPPKLEPVPIYASASTTALPSPTSSSSYMSTMSTMVTSKGDLPVSVSESSLQDLSSVFSQDFLNSDTLSNLPSSLGINLDNGTIRSSSFAARTLKPVTVPKVSSRAHDLLSGSLKQCEEQRNMYTPLRSLDVPPQRHSSVSPEATQLRQAISRLNEVENNFNKLKEASQRALEEFERDKKAFEKEVLNRQHLESSLLHVQRLYHRATHEEDSRQRTISPLDDTEIDHLARTRVELEKTCDQLKSYRNRLAKDIDTSMSEKQAGLAARSSTTAEQQLGALRLQIKSLTAERDGLLSETENLSKVRDEVLQEILMLNEKSAELSSMNNDLSNRLHRRSEDTVNRQASPPQSPLRMRVSSSNLKLDWSKVRKFGNRNKTDPADTLYGHQNLSTMSVSRSLQNLRSITTSPFKRSQDGGSRTPATIMEVDPIDFVRNCVVIIEDLTEKCPEEGLYRKSGSSKEVNETMNRFKRGSFSFRENEEEGIDVHVIAHVLKRYLGKEMPEPVLDRQFLDAASWSSGEPKTSEFQKLINALPAENKTILKVLMHHLHRLHSQHPKTRMDANKLGTVFGPTLTHLPMGYSEYELANSTVEYLITNVDTLLPDHPSR